MRCLEENTLVALAESRLPPESLVDVEAHARRCTGCQDLIVAALNFPGLARTGVTERLRPTGDAPPLATERVGPMRSARPVVPEAVAAGTSIGRFTVLGLVGRGGMGEVYAAYDPSLDRRVALKLMHVESAAREERGQERMLREAQAIAKLSHPNVIVVYEVGTFEQRVFMAMEFIEGKTLADWLTQGRRSWKEIVEVYIQAARGLSAAHHADLVHRDFKPQNVMVATDGTVRVMDFGLARRIGAPRSVDEGDFEGSGSANGTDATLTRTGEQLGTPLYMAPEQFVSRRIDARTDQFSFCVALYWSLFGVHPFGGTNLSEITRSAAAGMVAPPAKTASAPAWLQRVTARGLAVDPDSRWPSMDELAAALGRDPARRKRLVGLTAIAAGACVALAVVGAGTRARDQAVCSGGPARLAAAWERDANFAHPESRREAVRTAILKSGVSEPQKTWERVAALLDRHATKWLGMYREACEATHVRREESEETLDLRMACLNDNLESTGALTHRLIGGDARVIEHAVEATGSLGDVERCDNIKQLRSRIQLPKDPLVRVEVIALRQRLAAAELLFDLGQTVDAITAVDGILERADTLQYCPLQADLLALKGDAQLSISDERGVPTLEKAITTGESCGYGLTVARAVTGTVYYEGYHDPKQAERSANLARSILSRIGGDTRLESWLALNYGGVLVEQGRLDEAKVEVEHSLTLKERLFGGDHPDVARSLGSLTIVLGLQGRFSEALTSNERAMEIFGRWIPDDSLIWNSILANHAEILVKLGRLDEAADFAHRALRALDRSVNTSPTLRSGPLDTLGVIAMSRGAFNEAIADFEGALHPPDLWPVIRAEAQFHLASALEESGGDRSRAIGLATSALSVYANGPGFVRQRTEVQTWLDEVRARGRDRDRSASRRRSL